MGVFVGWMGVGWGYVGWGYLWVRGELLDFTPQRLPPPPKKNKKLLDYE